MTSPTSLATHDGSKNVEELAQLFLRDGYVHLRGVISPEELEILREDSLEIIEGGWENVENESDYFHDVLPDTGEDVFHRVQYVFPKARRGSFVTLLGQPLILQLAQCLLGPDFLCAAEALVFKMPGNGREVSIHADADPHDPKLSPLIFNVDFYLDDSSLENGCLWVAPGSHLTAHQEPRERIYRGLDFEGMIPIEVRAGDVLFHNVRLVHGSPRSKGGALRRTLYYEFQSLPEMEKQGGPRPGFAHTTEFVRDRISLLSHAIEQRAQQNFAHDETPFEYAPPVARGASTPAAEEKINLRPALGYNKYI